MSFIQNFFYKSNIFLPKTIIFLLKKVTLLHQKVTPFIVKSNTILLDRLIITIFI